MQDRVSEIRRYERQKTCEHLIACGAVQFGSEPLPSGSPQPVYDDHYFSEIASQLCFYCEAANHSQHRCPLKQCSICGQYGHSFRACRGGVMVVMPRSSFFRSFGNSSE